MKNNINYIIFLFVFAIVIGLIGFFLVNNKISNNEHPTKEEWLEIYVTHRIEDETDAWKQRIAVRVGIFSVDKEIVVTLTSVNGQGEISQTAKNYYISNIENIVRSILKEYDWVKGYNLSVQYI